MLALFCLTLCLSCAPETERGPVILAAASMQEALGDIAVDWQGDDNAMPSLSYAGSATVARQVADGAPADLVITADRRWMDWLAEQGALRGEPVAIAGNRLVIIAPSGDASEVDLESLAAAPDTFRVAMGDPDTVPAGIFAREALQGLGLWDSLQGHIVPTENVRLALALVERGEAARGIVYASDATASRGVRVVREIDPSLHAPIIYFAALTNASDHADAADLLAYLSSTNARRHFTARGFASL
ncbi:molybdate ABC transporter substrate-binding protein [Aurantiacibacter gangjinensis]|nr:molybdate ABC transporter substrate-binding protein [Aurantiacibacter gangjinensis]